MKLEYKYRLKYWRKIWKRRDFMDKREVESLKKDKQVG